VAAQNVTPVVEGQPQNWLEEGVTVLNLVALVTADEIAVAS
jgi:hypothetical protein